MEWNEKLQKIIDYVEHHLQRTEESINQQEITKIAGCSYSFFLKVFSYMNGITFAEYIRYRKMTLAGYDLKSTQLKVIEISYKYGYESPTSFTKAFQQFHGVTCKEAREQDTKLRVYPKMQLYQNQSYAWKLVKKPELRLVGITTKISYQDHQQARLIPAFWNECQKNGSYAKLIALDEGEPAGIYAIFQEFNQEEQTQSYTLMVATAKDIPDGFQEYILPASTWAIFDCYGPQPNAIQHGWRYLQEEWLLQYPFQHAPYPELEWYSDGNSYDLDYLSQIWIPIIK